MPTGGGSKLTPSGVIKAKVNAGKKPQRPKLKEAQGKAQAALDEVHEREIFAYNDADTPTPFDETLTLVAAGGSKFIFTYAYPTKHTAFAEYCNKTQNLVQFATQACIGNEYGISRFFDTCFGQQIHKEYLWVTHVNTSGDNQLLAFVQVCIFLPLLTEKTCELLRPFKQTMPIDGVNVWQLSYNYEYITDYSLLHKALLDDRITEKFTVDGQSFTINAKTAKLTSYAICNSKYICGKVPLLWNQCALYKKDVCPVIKISAEVDEFSDDEEVLMCTIINKGKQIDYVTANTITPCHMATQSQCVAITADRASDSSKRKHTTTKVVTSQREFASITHGKTERTLATGSRKQRKQATADIDTTNNARVAYLFASHGWVDRVKHNPQDKLTASVIMQNNATARQGISRRKPQPETLLLEYGNDTLFDKVKPTKSKSKAQFYLQKDAHNRHAKLLNVLRTNADADVTNVQRALDAVYTRGQLEFTGSRWQDADRKNIITHLSLTPTDNARTYNFPYLATQLTYNYARTYISAVSTEYTIYVGAPKFNSDHSIYKTSDGTIELHYNALQHEFTMYTCTYGNGIITSKTLFAVAISTKGYIIEFGQTAQFKHLINSSVDWQGCILLDTVSTAATADLIMDNYGNVTVQKSHTLTLRKGDIICYIKNKTDETIIWSINKGNVGRVNGDADVQTCQQYLNLYLGDPSYTVCIRRAHRKSFIVTADRQEHMSEMVLQLQADTIDIANRPTGFVNADDLNASITWIDATTRTRSTISSVCPSQDIPNRTDAINSTQYEEYKTIFKRNVLPHPNKYFCAFGTLDMLSPQQLDKFCSGTDAYQQTIDTTRLQTIYKTNVETINWLRTFLATLNDNSEKNKTIPKIWRTRILARLNNIPATAKQMLANYQYIQVHTQADKKLDPIPAFQLCGDKERAIYGTYYVTQHSTNEDVVYHNTQKGFYCVCKQKELKKFWVIVEQLKDTVYLATSMYTNTLIPSSFEDVQVVDLTKNTGPTLHSVLHQEPAQTLIQCLKVFGQIQWPNYALENAWMQLGKAIDADIVQSNDYIQLNKIRDQRYTFVREPTIADQPKLNAVLGEYSYESLLPCNDLEYYKQFDFLCSPDVYTNIVMRMLAHVKFLDTQINIESSQVLYAAHATTDQPQDAELRNQFVPANRTECTIKLRVDSVNPYFVDANTKTFHTGNIVTFQQLQQTKKVNSCGAWNITIVLNPVADAAPINLCYGQIHLKSKSPEWPGMQTITFANALQRVIRTSTVNISEVLRIQGTHAAATCSDALVINPATQHEYYDCVVYSDNIENIHKGLKLSTQLTLLTNVNSVVANDNILNTLYNYKQKWKFILQQIHTPRNVQLLPILDTCKVVCNGTLTLLTVVNSDNRRELHIGETNVLILNLRTKYDDQKLVLQANQHKLTITSQYTFQDSTIPESIFEFIQNYQYYGTTYQSVLAVAQRINTPYITATRTDSHSLLPSLKKVLKSIRTVYQFTYYVHAGELSDVGALKTKITDMYTELKPSNLDDIKTCIKNNDCTELCTNIVLCIDHITAQAAQDELLNVLSTLTRHKNEATTYARTLALRGMMQTFVDTVVPTVTLNGNDDVHVSVDTTLPIRIHAESAIVSTKKDNILDQFGKPFKTAAAKYTAYIWPNPKTSISTDNTNVVFAIAKADSGATKQQRQQLDDIITQSGKTLCQHTFKVRIDPAGTAAKVKKQLSAHIDGVDVTRCVATPIFVQRDDKKPKDVTVTARFKKQMKKKCNVATKPDKGEIDVICAKNCDVKADDTIPCKICERQFHLNCVTKDGLRDFVCCVCQHKTQDTRHKIETLHKAMYELLYVILYAPCHKTNNTTIHAYCNNLKELNTAWLKKSKEYTTRNKLIKFCDYAMYQIINFALKARKQCYEAGTAAPVDTELELTSTIEWTMVIGNKQVYFTRTVPWNCDQPLTQKLNNPKVKQNDNSLDIKNPTKWFYDATPNLIHKDMYFLILHFDELFNGERKKVHTDFVKLRENFNNAGVDGEIVLHTRTISGRDWQAAKDNYTDTDDSMPYVLTQFENIKCQEDCISAMQLFSDTAVYRQIVGKDETGKHDSSIYTTKQQLEYYKGTDAQLCELLCTMFNRLEWARIITSAITKAKHKHRAIARQPDGDKINMFAYKPAYVANLKIFGSEKQMQAWLLNTDTFTGTIADVCTKYDDATAIFTKLKHGLHDPTLQTTATNCAVECLYKIVTHNSLNTTEAIAFELEWLALQQSNLARDMSNSQVQVCMELYWWDKQSRSLMTQNVLNDLMFFEGRLDQQGLAQTQWNIAGQPVDLSVYSFGKGFACVDVSTTKTVSYNTPNLCKALRLPHQNITHWHSLWQLQETSKLYVKFQGLAEAKTYALDAVVTLDKAKRPRFVGAWYGSAGYGKQPGEDATKKYLEFTRDESFEVSDGLLRKRPVKQHVQWMTNDMFYRELIDYLDAQQNLQNLWQFEKLLIVMPETSEAGVTERTISKEIFDTIQLDDNKFTLDENVVVAWQLPKMPKVSLALPHDKTLTNLFGSRITFTKCIITTVDQYISPTHLTALQIGTVRTKLKGLIETLNSESKLENTSRDVQHNLHDTTPKEIVQSMYFLKDGLSTLPAYTSFQHNMDNLIQYGIFADTDKCYTQTMFVSHNATPCNPWEKFELNRELTNLYEQLNILALFYDKQDKTGANLLWGAFAAQLAYCKRKWGNSTLGKTDRMLFETLAAQVDAWNKDELVKPIEFAFETYELNAATEYTAVREQDAATGWATFYDTNAAIVAACALYYKNAVLTCGALNNVGINLFLGSLMATELCNNDVLANEIMTLSWKEEYAPLVFKAIKDVDETTLKELGHGISEAYVASTNQTQPPKPKRRIAPTVLTVGPPRAQSLQTAAFKETNIDEDIGSSSNDEDSFFEDDGSSSDDGNAESEKDMSEDDIAANNANVASLDPGTADGTGTPDSDGDVNMSVGSANDDELIQKKGGLFEAAARDGGGAAAPTAEPKAAEDAKVEDEDGDASEAAHPAMDIDDAAAKEATDPIAEPHGVEETDQNDDMETGNDTTAAVSLSLLELVQQIYSGDCIQLSPHIFRQGDTVYKCKQMTPAQHVDANYMLKQSKCLDEIKNHIAIPLIQDEVWNRLQHDGEDTEYCGLKMNYSERDKKKTITVDDIDTITTQLDRLLDNDYYYTNFHMGHVHWGTDGNLVYFSAETMQQKQFSKRQTLVHTHAKFKLFPPTGNSPMYSDDANDMLATIVDMITRMFLHELYPEQGLTAEDKTLVENIHDFQMVDLTYEECCSAFTDATGSYEVWVKLVSVPQATLLEINKCFEPITNLSATWSRVDVPFHTNKLVCNNIKSDPLTEDEKKSADFITSRIKAIDALFEDHNCFYTGKYGAHNNRLDQQHMVFVDNPKAFNTYSTTQQLWQLVPKDKDIPLPLERENKINVLRFVCYFQAFLDKYPFEDPIERGKDSQFMNWSSYVSVSQEETDAFKHLHFLHKSIQKVQIY